MTTDDIKLKIEELNQKAVEKRNELDDLYKTIEAYRNVLNQCRSKDANKFVGKCYKDDNGNGNFNSYRCDHAKYIPANKSYRLEGTVVSVNNGQFTVDNNDYWYVGENEVLTEITFDEFLKDADFLNYLINKEKQKTHK